jgi:alkaline phosphatase
LTAKYPEALMPMVSENFNKYLSWDGMGEPEEQELANLLQMIEMAHEQDKQVRLWAAPDTPAVWELLLDIGINLINTDHIHEFREFFLIRE